MAIVRAEDVVLQPEPARAGGEGWHYAEVAAAILKVFDPRLEPVTDTRSYRVLEAGGGSASHLPLPATAEVTTIDISPEQLAANSYAAEKLLGDLETFDYGARRYSLIIAWDVLEHLSRPEAALQRFADILEPGGRLVIVGPQRYTLKGLVTRMMPHWVHVAFYRHILGSENAGKPGHAPFPAHLAVGAVPSAIAAFVRRKGLTIERFTGYESSHVAAVGKKSALLLYAYRAAERVLGLATLGRYRRGVTDFFLIAQRPRR